MSELVAALDNLQLGENMNCEYKWSSNNNMNELLTQFYFQLVRDANQEALKVKYYEMLDYVFNIIVDNDRELYGKYIYKLIAHMRDIPNGKGEYNLSYFLISNLYKYKDTKNGKKYEFVISKLVEFIIEKFVILENEKLPYGSWKDIKYLLDFHLDENSKLKKKYYTPLEVIEANNDMIVKKCIQLVCQQLHKDITKKNPSLLCKWIPREKSKKFGWITPLLAYNYYKEWIITANTKETIDIAKKKCLTKFRQLISGINNRIETTQIYQCDNRWGEIDFEKKVTSITMKKQSKAFLYTNKHTTEYNSEYYDRIKCSENYKKYITESSKNNVNVKGKRVSIIDFVKDAYYLNNNYYEKELMNSQWRDNSSLNEKLGNIIAMVDTSFSMHDNKMGPLFSAIGLGIRIAEKSKFGNRVMTFSTNPKWVNLDDIKDDFVERVKKISKAEWGCSTNFRKALELILDTAIQNNIDPKVMENMSLVILSDMQIDCADNTDNMETMFEMMKNKYYNAGIKTRYRIPYNLPNIVFWNLRQTNGFPNTSMTKNTVMISGNSPMLLNEFATKGIDCLKEITPIIMITDILNNKRYNILDKKFTEIWNMKKDINSKNSIENMMVDII
jgi:hypothetical protein